MLENDILPRIKECALLAHHECKIMELVVGSDEEDEVSRLQKRFHVIRHDLGPM